MAEETITRLIDDLDGGDATQKVLLGLNGEWRALDLNDKNHKALLAGIERFWAAGTATRFASAGGQRTRGVAKAKRGYDISMLREWAAEKKVNIPARGRISGQTVEQFQSDLASGWQPKSA